MVNESQRIAGIEQSANSGEFRRINYKGENIILPVKRIPLEYLVYNAHNGRIGSSTKSYESTHHILNPADEVDKNTIEQLLYDSAENRNEKTLESLKTIGQQESGIVTKDGVIIDGNRRAMLLNILHRRGEVPGFFSAIVLPDMLSENRREIVTLETSYQMGVDSKVDYDPIEKYIRCKELKLTHKLKISEIASLLAENEKRILDWLEILALMEEYLIYLGSPQVYTRLSKREGHFVDLRSYLKSYSRTNKLQMLIQEDHDLENMKRVYFDYIRLGMPVLRTRVIGRPTNSFFSNKEIWSQFYADHRSYIEQYQEPEFLKVKQERQDNTNEEVIFQLDSSWRENVEANLNSNLEYYEGILKDKLEKYGPVKLLRKVVNSLGQISDEALVSSDRVQIEPLVTLIIERGNHFYAILTR